MKMSELIMKWLSYNVTDYTLFDKKLLLYHGGPDEVKYPMVSKAKVTGERGKGFYLFFSQKPAALNKYTWDGYINTYIFDLEKLDKMLIPFSANENGYIIRFYDNVNQNANSNNRTVLTLDGGVKGYTKIAGGQFVIHRQDVLDECLEFYSSAFQRELRDIYIKEVKRKGGNVSGVDLLFEHNLTSFILTKKPVTIIDIWEHQEEFPEYFESPDGLEKLLLNNLDYYGYNVIVYNGGPKMQDLVGNTGTEE